MSAPIIKGKPLSPVHWSKQNGVHADLGNGPNKQHIPFQGQTTLQTFRIGGRPTYENDRKMANMGGTLKIK